MGTQGGGVLFPKSCVSPNFNKTYSRIIECVSVLLGVAKPSTHRVKNKPSFKLTTDQKQTRPFESNVQLFFLKNGHIDGFDPRTKRLQPQCYETNHPKGKYPMLSCFPKNCLSARFRFSAMFNRKSIQDYVTNLFSKLQELNSQAIAHWELVNLWVVSARVRKSRN